jgi:transposase
VKVAGPPCRTACEGARGASRAAGHYEQEVPTVNDGKASVARKATGAKAAALHGAIIAGFDVHMRQITVQACGGTAHLAETVETRALRGRKRRAKTDRQDALWLRELLAEGRLPESWIAPEHVRQWRSRLHLRKALIDERTQSLLRIRSVLYHHAISAGAPARIARGDGRRFLERLDLPADARERVTVALFMISTLEAQIHQIERELRKLARRQTGCQALMGQFGVGELIALTFLAELGDATRMSSSRKAIRFAGLEMPASNCISCSGDFGFSDVAGVRDALPAFLLDAGTECDPQAVGGVAVGGELVA